MAVLIDTDLKTMNYPFDGEPFVAVPAKSSIDLMAMDYSFNGQPFVANPTGGEEEPANTTAFFAFF